MRRWTCLLLACAGLLCVPAARACDGDIDGDGEVNSNDIALALLDYGACQFCPSDLDGDGEVGASDVALVLLNWGTCPPVVDWTLYTRIDGSSTIATDATGAVVKTWTGASFGASVAYLRPDGSLVRPCWYTAGTFNAGGRGGRVQIFNPAGTLVNDLIVATSQYQQHHDVAMMPNGDILCIVWEQHTQAEGKAAGRTTLNNVIWSETIMQIRPTGYSTFQTVWTWRLWDHLVQDANPALANYGSVSGNPGLLDINVGSVTTGGDWMHMNSIDYNEARDEILFSSRTLSEVFVIDHSTTTIEAAGHAGGARGKGGDFLYRWGNPANSRRGTATDQYFNVVHSATWIPEGLPNAGDIMAFNNGDRSGSANDWSSAVQISPPRDSSGAYVVPATAAFGPAAPTWTHGSANQFYGGNTQCGAYRTLDNTTLITLTGTGEVFEVNAAGQRLFQTTVTGQVARAVRYRNIGGVWVGP
jgi:hypothetical protein